MTPKKINRWLPVAVLAIVAGWPANGLMGQDTRPVLGKPEPARVVVELSPELLEALGVMKQQLEELRYSDAAKSKQIEDLQRLLERQSSVSQSDLTEVGPLIVPPQTSGQQQKQDAKSALDRAVEELDAKSRGAGQESPLDRAVRGLPEQPPLASRPVGGANLQLIDISLDGLFAAGASTERDESLQNLQGGGHDPRKRGFTVQNVELSIMGAVDPYFDAETHIIYFIDPIEGETVVELEEAFMTTRSLPCGLQLEMGQFFTEFGRLNPTHPHVWHWQDQPIINTRVFGPDGLRNPGFRLGWLLPVEWFSQFHFGIQNANGETAASFLANDEFFGERPIAGRPFTERDVRALNDLLYLLRWENSWTTCCDEATWLAGTSALFGPNATGPDGHTEVFGADLTMKWKPAKSDRGWPFVIWESEFIYRHYAADNFSDLGDPIDPLDDVILAGETLRDWGFYTQVLYGCKPRWAYGVRYEFVRGNGPSLDDTFAVISRDNDPFRDRRHRFAPLVAWYPTEFSRFRFQYNFDHAEHIEGKDAHSFWLGAEFVLGSHPAHKF